VPVTHYRIHTYRPGNLRDEIPKKKEAIEEEEVHALIDYVHY
jgi:hypothetical protein